ncbi:hypothetical protein OPV22_016928 [Ensete ventricosum]|uniref:Protein SPT2 homolog n=1 Tax=Ensete ventricosum TaxID=4639 RepID=A0AAV8R128_ENSVE|nr:hypothetical protein OPV22_016928 [Ensete ventricosum]
MYGSAPKENVHQISHYRTEDYDRYEEDSDEYEEEASEHDGEDEQEAPKPTKEEQEFLSVREQLKDRIRKKLKKQNARALGHSSQTQDKRRTTTNATFGSFFGPSQPVIASRVIEESRSIRETKHVMTNMSSSVAKKRDATASASTLSTQQYHKKPAVVNEIKNKAQTLKDMRDYSFLLSDDTDFPTAKEQPATRRVSAPKSDARYAQTSVKSQLPMNQPAQLVSVVNGLRNPDSGKQHIQRKTGFAKEAPLNRPLPALTDSRKILSGAVGNGCSKPMGTNPSQRVVGNGCSKPMGTNPSQRVVGNGCSKPMGTNPSQRVVGNGSSKPMGTNPSQRVVGNGSIKPMGTNPSQRVVGNGSSKPMVTNLSQRAVGNGSSRPVVTNPSQRVVGNGSSRPVVTNPSQRVVGNGSSRPVVTNPSQRDVGNGSSRPMVSNSSQRVIGNGSSKPMGNSSSQRKVPIQAAGANKLLSKVINDPYLKKDISAAKPHSSALKHYPEQKRLTQGLDQVKTTAKQPMPPSKSQPIKQSFSHGNLDNRLKRRRPSGRNLSDEEDVDYRSLIRGMFGYNPNKYAGMDEDDSDMEVGFDVIQKEERISSKIARKEDEEQLRLIEEEEERERQMRRRMKKKLKH